MSALQKTLVQATQLGLSHGAAPRQAAGLLERAVRLAKILASPRVSSVDVTAEARAAA